MCTRALPDGFSNLNHRAGQHVANMVSIAHVCFSPVAFSKRQLRAVLLTHLRVSVGRFPHISRLVNLTLLHALARCHVE